MSRSQETVSPKRKKWQYSLIFEYQKTKSKQLAEKLVVGYGHMVGAIARKLSRNHPDLYEDLFQVGQIALLRSLERYDRSRGSSFEAYARKNMKGSMMNYLRDKAWVIPVPRWMKDHWVKVQRAIDELTMEQEATPSVEEIASHIHLSVDLTKKLLTGKAQYQITSFDAPIGSEGEFTLSDVIGREATEYHTFETQYDIQKALAHLSKKEKQILHLNYLEGVSQRSIAHRLGISQMTVSRIIRQAIEKLKQSLLQPASPI
jgi:RNA polymerase sigma-B factor